jgi:hypothetical protein
MKKFSNKINESSENDKFHSDIINIWHKLNNIKILLESNLLDPPYIKPGNSYIDVNKIFERLYGNPSKFSSDEEVYEYLMSILDKMDSISNKYKQLFM